MYLKALSVYEDKLWLRTLKSQKKPVVVVKPQFQLRPLLKLSSNGNNLRLGTTRCLENQLRKMKHQLNLDLRLLEIPGQQIVVSVR